MHNPVKKHNLCLEDRNIPSIKFNFLGQKIIIQYEELRNAII